MTWEEVSSTPEAQAALPVVREIFKHLSESGTVDTRSATTVYQWMRANGVQREVYRWFNDHSVLFMAEIVGWAPPEVGEEVPPPVVTPGLAETTAVEVPDEGDEEDEVRPDDLDSGPSTPTEPDPVQPAG